MLTSAKIVETSVIKVETRCQHSAIDKITIPILDVDSHLHKHLKLNMNVNTDRHTLLLNCALIGGITCLAISYSVDDLRNERMSCSNFRFFLMPLRHMGLPAHGSSAACRIHASFNAHARLPHRSAAN
ncbi:hypothetical protein TOT_020000281 [Theileria orientalis strain Shintoku]|uniref:Uncharacterized protein n=1 Tax=Theileria orientalis strain Shintoku TaxID=869250 RepID=J4DP34_THEOR|nr:hypothetical protein TOT_020000281 [Theileria orientalis strain Shintoku]BAM40014.1 hypothetical protein TOT_020000281 [Theileria orientalis strain Shintoku]|eukprot:XP_009690315.1 hypothetical protein TOT_020000281 [Theileria orientalis strain Shintoku]